MAQLSLSLLGGFDVLRDDQPIADFGTDKVRALLAYLAVEAERPQRRDRLAGLLWPEVPDTRARQSLRQSLSLLRSALETPDGEPLVLTSGNATIWLNPAHGLWLDVAEFKALIRACRDHRHRALESCLPCLQRLQRLTELYRGDFLAQFYLPDASGFEEWALMEREWLRQHAMSALDGVSRYYERRGELADARDAARRLVTLEPWREEAQRHLIRLLACAGERSAALAQYKTCRQTLSEELGVEPTVETAQLARQIKAPTWTAENAPADLCPATPTLPVPPSATVGRGTELAELAELVADPDERLITLTGPGGIGKTRLALEVASQHRGLFPDGVVVVHCEDLDPGAPIAPSIVDALGLTPTAERPATQLLLAYLRDRELLLVLDNLDHLLDCCDFIVQMLQRAPGLTVLTTSRETLRLQEERIYAVGGLTYPATPDQVKPEAATATDACAYGAIALFLQRAQQVNRHFTVTPTTAPSIIRICQMVAGSALGIELAAAAAAQHGSVAIAETLTESFDVLSSSARNVPTRHRSLRAICDHTWQSMPLMRQTHIAALSVFVGGFDGEAAVAIADITRADLTRLLARSLVQQKEEGRYALHEVLRHYAAAKLATTPTQRAETRARHARHFADWLADQQSELHGTTQQAALAMIAQDLENVRTAWAWALDHGNTDVAAQALGSLYDFHRMRGRFEEGLALIEPAVECWRGAEEAEGLWGAVRARQGVLVDRLGRYGESRIALTEALTVSRRHRNVAEERFCLLHLAQLCRRQGQPTEAETLARQALALADDDAPDDAARAYFILGQLRYRAGDPATAQALYTESLALAEKAGDPRLSLVPLNALGDMACHRGGYVEARRTFERCLALSRTLNDRFHMALHLNNLGTTHHLQENRSAAQSYYAESLALCREIGDQVGEAFALSNLGEAAFELGKHAYAEQAYTSSLAIARTLDDTTMIAVCLNNLGEIAHRRGDQRGARAYFAEALRQAIDAEQWMQATKTMVNAAALLAASRQSTSAAAMLAQLSRHPASEQSNRDKATRLLAQLETVAPLGACQADAPPLEVMAQTLLTQLTDQTIL